MLGAKITHGTPFRRAVEEDLIDPKATVQIGLRGSSYTVDAHAWQISKVGFVYFIFYIIIILLFVVLLCLIYIILRMSEWVQTNRQTDKQTQTHKQTPHQRKFSLIPLSHLCCQGFRIVQAHQCWHKSLEPLMEEVKAMMGDRPVYLSFDIDAIDPGFCPGTGKV